jgi:hypothetical protein
MQQNFFDFKSKFKNNTTGNTQFEKMIPKVRVLDLSLDPFSTWTVKQNHTGIWNESFPKSSVVFSV